MAKFEDELVLKDSASDKLDEISEKMSGVSAKGEKLKGVFNKMSGGLVKLGKGAFSVAGGLTKVGLAALGISDVTVGALALSCAQAAKDAEQLNATMDLLTGSSEKSKKVFADLDKEVGIFSRDTLRGLSLQMLDNGISTEKLIPTLKMLEGFSMGSADTLQKLTTELTKVSGTGRVTAQSLKALSMIGIDGQKEMQKQLGVTPKLFNKLLSAGRITYGDYEKLITRVYNSTDKYNQSMDRLSGTLNGKFDTVRNKLDIVKQRLTESLGRIALPYIEKVANKMGDWADSLNNLPIEKVEKLNEVFEATKKIFEGIWWLIKKIGSFLKGLYNIAKGFIGVITGLATDFKSFAKAFNSMSWTDIGKGLWNGDLLDKVSEIQRKNKAGEIDISTNQIIPKNEGESNEEYFRRIDAMKNAGINKNSSALGNVIKAQITLDAPNLFAGNQSEKSGDLLSKISEIQANNQSKTDYITKSITENPSYSNNTTNMSNVFNISGNVREEADINKIGQSIADIIQLKFSNMGNP